MKLRLFLEPQQGATYEQLLHVAQTAEAGGFDGLVRSDHYMVIGHGSSGLPGSTDAWVSLAGLARETKRLRLGTLVSSATFRHPGIMAVTVAQVDAMSGGRVEMGLGAGWYEGEHKAYAIPFPPLKERFERLEEQLAIISGLWATPTGERFSYQGAHYQVENSPALPKPAQSKLPIIIGGTGPTKTPRLAARYASEYNAGFSPLEAAGERYERVREACQAAGRDPRSMNFSTALVVCCGRDEAEVARKAEATHPTLDLPASAWLKGTPDQLVDALGRYAELGTGTFYCQFLNLQDLDQIELLAARVLPQVQR
ncbi:MAG: LLM class F420-dependent oxidoreductase [Chloroflexota bacterium]